MQDLERTESESKLVACAEIMQNQYDKKQNVFRNGLVLSDTFQSIA